MLNSLALVSFLAGALLVIIGARRLGLRVCAFGILLLIAIPFFLHAWGEFASSVGGDRVAAALVGGAVFALGYARYRTRRHLAAGRAVALSSTKRRVEPRE